MASSLPIPVPPRTPTPPPDDSPNPSNQPSGFDAGDHDSLSPLAGNLPAPRSPQDGENRSRLSPQRSSFNLSPSDVAGQNDNASAGPFNFKTATMAKSPVVKSVSPGTASSSFLY